MPAPGGRGLYFVSGKPSGSLIRHQVNKRVNADIVVDDVFQPILSPDES